MEIKISINLFLKILDPFDSCKSDPCMTTINKTINIYFYLEIKFQEGYPQTCHSHHCKLTHLQKHFDKANKLF